MKMNSFGVMSQNSVCACVCAGACVVVMNMLALTYLRDHLPGEDAEEEVWLITLDLRRNGLRTSV